MSIRRPRRNRKPPWKSRRFFTEKKARFLLAQSHIEQLQRQLPRPPRQP
ncbi:hypothetical protein ES705_19571 [subsurface metagenome]